MRFIIVSNGHGEDVVGVALAEALIARGHEARALPIVGRGDAYAKAGIESFGPRKTMPSGGFVLDRRSAFLDDLRAGWLRMTVRQCRSLRRERDNCDALIVVGDIYALGIAFWFGRAPVFQMQLRVSVRAWDGSSRRPDEAYTSAEYWMMRRIAQVYPREREGEEWLRGHGVLNVKYLGNPMLDALRGDATVDLPAPYLMLLPGSRSDSSRTLPVMLAAARLLREAGLTPIVNVWPTLKLQRVANWTLEIVDREQGVIGAFVHDDGFRVNVTRNAFHTVAKGARLAVSTSGTASEQVAGMGIPVVGFVIDDAWQFTGRFAQTQKRMLREALTLVPPRPEAIATAASELWHDHERYAAAQRDGRAALGEPGAAERIVDDVVVRVMAR